MADATAPPIRMQTIVVAPFTGATGTLTYSTLGLSTDGRVYRYDPPCQGWIPWEMVAVTCAGTHKGNR
jgi:hypothetical protein